MSEFILIISVINIIFLFLGPIIVIIFVIVDYPRAKAPKVKGTIVTEYKPPEDLTPIQAASLVGYNYPEVNLLAEIFYLIEQGFIKIEKIAEEYYLSPIETEKRPKYNYHNYLLEYLFRVSKKIKTNDLRFISHESATADLSFAFNSSETKNQMSGFFHFKDYFNRGYHSHWEMSGYYKVDFWSKSTLVKLGYIDRGLASIKTKFTTAGLIGIFVSIAFFSFLNGFILPSAFLALYGLFRPNHTQKGALMREYLLGYREYLKRVEVERLKAMSSPNSDTLYIPSYLPYAMAFQLHNDWLSEFKNLLKSDYEPKRVKISNIFGNR